MSPSGILENAALGLEADLLLLSVEHGHGVVSVSAMLALKQAMELLRSAADDIRKMPEAA